MQFKWSGRFEGYSLGSFKKDLLSGIIVGIIAVPLAMSFAIASGVNPVLYVGFYSRTLEFLNVRVGEETVDRLAKEGQSIRFSFDSVNNKRQIVISIPNDFISMIAKFHFTLELS